VRGQFTLIFEKGLGRGRRLASADTSPGKIVEDISKTRMFSKGMDALSPALLKFFLKSLKRIDRMIKREGGGALWQSGSSSTGR
jgi:hypothetical protein